VVARRSLTRLVNGGIGGIRGKLTLKTAGCFGPLFGV
jgi:hypothetical protein